MQNISEDLSEATRYWP